MWLAGLHFPDEPRGLAGHSDADVAAHAACDALFSAAGLGDLGVHFGTAEPAVGRAPAASRCWRGGPAGARGGVHDRQRRGAGHRQPPPAGSPAGPRPQRRSAPRRAPRSASPRTTTDGLGLTGRGEGVAAIATALVWAVVADSPGRRWTTERQPPSGLRGLSVTGAGQLRRRAPRRGASPPCPRWCARRARARRPGSGGPWPASASRRRTGRGRARGATGRGRPRRPS